MSLLEELKKNDLYAPYEKKLERLLKGGPGSGPQGGMSSGKAKMALANASRAANAASEKALGNSTRANHEDALDKHLNAASIARRAGNNKVAANHANAANYHADVAHKF